MKLGDLLFAQPKQWANMPGIMGDRKVLKDKLKLWVTGWWVKCLIVSGMASNFADSMTRLSDKSQHALTDLQANFPGAIEDCDESSKGTAFEREC